MAATQWEITRPVGRILVAVGFDCRLGSLIEAATALCQRLGAAMRLAHVCDPWTRSHLATAVESGPPELVGEIRAEAVRVAGRRLEALRRTLPVGLSVETTVLEGDVAKALVGDALEADVGLIAVGASRGGLAGTATGYSTAVSVIGESPVPVMILTDDARLAPKGADWRILVADDDSPVAAAALSLGGMLAVAAPGGSLVHLRIADYGHEAVGPEASTASAGGKLAARTAPERLERQVADAEARLLQRAAGLAATLDRQGGRYDAEVAFGNVPDEIERTAAAARIDLAVFGQHRAYHRRPMHVGHMPYKAMLSQRRAVIVVPEGP